jgi:hypothetical protein
MELSIDNIDDAPAHNSGLLSRNEIDLFGESKKWHLHWILIIALWAMFAIASAVLVIRAIHFVLPDTWCWLSPEKLQNIDKFLFSGAFGGILAKYAKYLLK